MPGRVSAMLKGKAQVQCGAHSNNGALHLCNVRLGSPFQSTAVSLAHLQLRLL